MKVEIDIKHQKAKMYGYQLSYINNRKALGLTAQELTVTIPTEDFIELAEAYVELFHQSQQEPQTKSTDK